MNRRTLTIPGGKNFIFSIFDDTDVATLGNIKPVYDCLSELGIYTTKSVWPLDNHDPNSNYKGSHSLQNYEYASYICELAQRGFEIAFHGASMESNTRDVTIQALGQFKEILNFNPRIYACHAGNRENIHWGEHRFSSGAFKLLYRLLNPRKTSFYNGHNSQSEFYWADICRESFDYVRTFTFNDINLLNIGRFPYRSEHFPYFKSCFFTSYADHVEEFNRLLSTKNQNKLANEKGVCIVTTHFGKGFVRDGILNSQTRYLLEQLVARNGCFMPVSAVLDYLSSFCGRRNISSTELFMLEAKWFAATFERKLHKLDYEKSELKYLGLK